MFRSRTERRLLATDQAHDLANNPDIKTGSLYLPRMLRSKTDEVDDDSSRRDRSFTPPYAKSSASTSTTSFAYIHSLAYTPPPPTPTPTPAPSDRLESPTFFYPPPSSPSSLSSPIDILPWGGQEEKKTGLGALRDRLKSKSSVNLRAESARTVSGSTRPTSKRTSSARPSPKVYSAGSPLLPTLSSQTFLIPADPFSTFSTIKADHSRSVTTPSTPTERSTQVSPTVFKSPTLRPLTLAVQPGGFDDAPVNAFAVVTTSRIRRPTLVSNKTLPTVLPSTTSVTHVHAEDLVGPASAPSSKESFFASIKRQHSIKDIFNLVHQHAASSTKRTAIDHVKPINDKFIVDIFAPPVPTIPSFPPHLPHLRRSRSFSAPPVSTSFFDLYAELGIDPPQEENLDSTYTRSSGRTSRTSERTSELKDARRSKDPERVRKGSQTLVGRSRSGTEVSQHRIEVNSVPSSPPPSLPLPLPVTSPFLHLLPWSETAIHSVEHLSGTRNSDRSALGLSSFGIGESGSLSDNEMWKRREVDGEENQQPNRGREATSREPPTASDSNSTITQTRHHNSIRSSQTGARNRQRSSGDASRSPSSPRERRLRTSSLVGSSGSSNSSDGDSDSDITSRNSDDIPLAERLPQAIQMQKEIQHRRREEKKDRRAVRSSGARRSRLIDVLIDSEMKGEGVGVPSGRIDGNSNPDWKGEGGVPATQLSMLLEEAARKLARSGELQAYKSSPQSAALGANHDSLCKISQLRPAASTRRQNTPPNPSDLQITPSISRHESVRKSGQHILNTSLQQSPALLHQSAGRFPAQSQQHRSRETSVAPDSKLKPQSSNKSIQSISKTDTEWLASSPHRFPQVSTNFTESTSTSSSNSRKPSIVHLALKGTSTAGSASPRIDSPGAHASLESHHHGQYSVVRKVSMDSAPSTFPPQRMEQHRILIESLHGPCEIVDVTHQTTAEDVIQILESRKRINRDGSSNLDWVLFEVFDELGCDRPVRMFETIHSVTRGWNPDTNMNAFLLKRSSHIRLVAPNLIPRLTPMLGTYVQWEKKKGKWSKRWLETRDGLVFLAKSNKGKDEIFLCHASAFDVYTFSRAHKSPKPFVFALKSHDAPSLFEDQADYLHVFSCDVNEGLQIYDALFIATSNSLSHGDSQSSQEPTTRHLPESGIGRQRPTGSQTLVDAKARSIFAGGSLLARLGK